MNCDITIGPKKIKEMDFHILFAPRSGSHMLVNAMNHHPELDVEHVDLSHADRDRVRDGRVKGYAGPTINGKSDKVIVLTRNSRDRLLSVRTELFVDGEKVRHAMKPASCHRDADILDELGLELQENKLRNIIAKASEYDQALFISYEKLTNNQNIREISRYYVDLICNFLGVDYHPMPTDYHKPEVIHA